MEKKKKKDMLPDIQVPRSTNQTDPQGSYTGRPVERWEFPVQDADDL